MRHIQSHVQIVPWLPPKMSNRSHMTVDRARRDHPAKAIVASVAVEIVTAGITETCVRVERLVPAVTISKLPARAGLFKY